MRILRLLPLASLIAAAPVPTPVQDRLIAEAAALAPALLAFERTTKSVRTGGGTTTKVNLVERWDGAAWTLLSIDGRKPSAGERHDHERIAKAVPVPGYHRLAPLLAAATMVSNDSQGRALWHIPVLPAGSVYTDSGDISDHLQADARVVRRGDGYWIDQLRIVAREPFKLNVLIKVAEFEQVIDYQLAGDGTPRIASQKSESKGTLFGFPGGEKAQVTFVYR